MNPCLFVGVTLNDNDKRMLTILLVILVILLIAIGLIGMLIRKTMSFQGKRVDHEMGDLVRYRVVPDPTSFRRVANAKNNRIFFKQSVAPVCIALFSLLFYLIYAGVTNGWGRNYWGEWSTILFIWDFGNSEYYSKFWGITMLNRWPNLLHAPQPEAQYWASYILCPLWLTAIAYYLVVIQAYCSRVLMISRRARTVYNKSLEDYNYYDTLKTNQQGQPIDPGSAPIPPANNPQQPPRP
jgi:hypothetical protein